MKDVEWLINRLKTMNLSEICWRINQKILQKKEKKFYFCEKKVTEIPLEKNLARIKIDINKLEINWNNSKWSVFEELDLFASFSYKQYKKEWGAGFQTNSIWPLKTYSPQIDISQRTDVGDIRTNWELNRHYQFAALAKSFYCTGEKKYLSEFIELFNDWNQCNLFLHGPEWTSMMELAIRVNSWLYSYVFLKKANVDPKLLDDIEHGIIVMANHINKHRAKYSSANNHLIVEMYAVALIGILTNYKPWIDKPLKILTSELPKQNYEDGINKEMSLHYQSFVMEAYGLLALTMKKNEYEIPHLWTQYLMSMSEFLTDSMDSNGSVIEFGDNDEGKILDLQGKLKNHYQYTLNLMGIVLGIKYTDCEWNENLNWIADEQLVHFTEVYKSPLLSLRLKGGYSFFRSLDYNILIGVDHARLGFEPLAAHGHADALSFQMNIEGKPIFVDSGTYNYHITPQERDYFRSTAAHNTVMINGVEQSEMLGPFIWGRRVKVSADIKNIGNNVILETACEGQAGKHTRIYEFNQRNELIIEDLISGVGQAFFHISNKVEYVIKKKIIELHIEEGTIVLQHDGMKLDVQETKHSNLYNHIESSSCVIITFKDKLRTIITYKQLK